MTDSVFDVSRLAYAFGEPQVNGVIRAECADFQVDEDLGFELSGEGEHVCLQIRKTDNNTDFIAKQIARLAGVKNMDVSYAGLKDRRAITTQWFSIYLSNKPEPDWQQLNAEGVEVLQVLRHNRKLRRGSLRGNRFTLRLRDLQGDIDSMVPRLQQIAEAGVPNYFGEQRFGHDNLGRATAMFSGEIKVKDRNKRSLYLSSVRSALFNMVASQRVEQGSWNKALAGDVMMLAGSHSVFCVESLDDSIVSRVEQHDIDPTGPLWGRGRLATSGDVLMLEQAVAESHPLWCEGLERAGMKQERRALRVPVTELEWQFTNDQCELSFFLPAGSYATSVLRELLHTAAV